MLSVVLGSLGKCFSPIESLWKIVPSDSKEIWDTNLSVLKDLYSIQDSSPVLA